MHKFLGFQQRAEGPTPARLPKLSRVAPSPAPHFPTPLHAPMSKNKTPHIFVLDKSLISTLYSHAIRPFYISIQLIEMTVSQR